MKMDNILPIIPVVVIIVAALIGILYIIVSKQKQEARTREKDYNVFIALGAIWLIAGLASDKIAIWPLGLIFLFWGLVGRLKARKK